MFNELHKQEQKGKQDNGKAKAKEMIEISEDEAEENGDEEDENSGLESSSSDEDL
jgi:hypothetical protein